MRDMDAAVADMQNGSGSDELVFFVNGKKVRKRSSVQFELVTFQTVSGLSKSDFDCLNRNTITPGSTYWLLKF